MQMLPSNSKLILSWGNISHEMLKCFSLNTWCIFSVLIWTKCGFMRFSEHCILSLLTYYNILQNNPTFWSRAIIYHCWYIPYILSSFNCIACFILSPQCYKLLNHGMYLVLHRTAQTQTFFLTWLYLQWCSAFPERNL